MNAAFVVRVDSRKAELPERIVRALSHALAAAGARVRFETGPRALPGTTVTVGVRDIEGRPRWLMPLRVDDEPDAAARETVSFLERWGFIPRAVPQRAA